MVPLVQKGLVLASWSDQCYEMDKRMFYIENESDILLLFYVFS